MNRSLATGLILMTVAWACIQNPSPGSDAQQQVCQRASDPGLHVSIVIADGLQAGGPADFYVTYSNNSVQSLVSALPAVPWSGTIEVTAPYAAGAASGPASFVFLARPDPGIGGMTQANVDTTACTDVEIDAVSHAPDAGP